MVIFQVHLGKPVVTETHHSFYHIYLYYC